MLKEEKSKAEVKEKKPKDDILSIVKEFISYFEETDRGKANDNSIKRG